MITNKDLKRCKEQVFTYSAQYQAPFYGREKSIAEVQKKAADLKQGEVFCISQPVGTGKTFLVNHLISEKLIPVNRGVSFLTVRDIADKENVLEQFPGDVLVVDEADIKLTYQKLIDGLKKVQTYLDDNNKSAIIIGDFSLKDPTIGNALKNKSFLQNFEPMDKSFVEGVLLQRFTSFMKDCIDVDFSLDSVIDPALIKSIAPEWMKQVNSFRGMFSLFQEIIKSDRYVRFNSDKAYLELSMFKDYLASNSNMGLEEDEQIEFLNMLKQMLITEYPGGSGISRGFTMEELYGLTEVADLDIDYDDFADEILYPMAMAGLLVSVGTPFKGKDGFIRRPQPYVPSLRLMLSLD